MFPLKLHFTFPGLHAQSESAGRGGLAVSMVTPNDVALVQAIEAHTAVKWTELEADDRKVAEIMVQVNTVRREGEMELGEK